MTAAGRNDRDVTSAQVDARDAVTSDSHVSSRRHTSDNPPSVSLTACHADSYDRIGGGVERPTRAAQVPSIDRSGESHRLTRQLDRVLYVMRGGEWRTLAEVVGATRGCFDTIDTEAAASARLRDLRKYGHTVERRRRGGAGNLWEYRATPPVKAGEQLTFGGIR